jgi:hypothetical protein
MSTRVQRNRHLRRSGRRNPGSSRGPFEKLVWHAPERIADPKDLGVAAGQAVDRTGVLW